jgi:hypothetical protein
MDPDISGWYRPDLECSQSSQHTLACMWVEIPHSWADMSIQHDCLQFGTRYKDHMGLAYKGLQDRLELQLHSKDERKRTLLCEVQNLNKFIIVHCYYWMYIVERSCLLIWKESFKWKLKKISKSDYLVSFLFHQDTFK